VIGVSSWGRWVSARGWRREVSTIRKLAAISFLAIALIFVVTVVPSDARGGGHGGGRGGGHHGGFHHGFRGRVFVGVGPAFWWDPFYPYWYSPPYYYGYEPSFVEPPVYVQAPQTPEQGYWHYCMSAQAYYPSVQMCAEGWVKVAPKSE